MRSSNDKKFKEVPEVISDKSKSRLFKRGKFLGKGGFARCYELLDEKTKAVVAGKVVSKVLLQKQYQKDKVRQKKYCYVQFIKKQCFTQVVLIHKHSSTCTINSFLKKKLNGSKIIEKFLLRL